MTVYMFFVVCPAVKVSRMNAVVLVKLNCQVVIYFPFLHLVSVS